jgi:6-phosphogluconolactonase (cycloisomerase 2 family)
VWTANTGSNSVSLYVLRNNGTVRLIAHRDTSAYGRLPFELAVDRAGKFLYELNVAPGTIHVMQVTDDEFQGALQDTATFDLPPGSTPIGLVILER